MLTPLWLAIALLAHAYAYPQGAVRWTAGTPLGPLAARVARWNAGADASALPDRARDAAVLYESSNDVVGSLQEINVGRIALVDGLAWTGAGGTVVRLLGKPVAGRRLAGSVCPTAHLAALELLRDAPYAQITVDESGRSAYLAYGRASGPSVTEREVSAREWKIRIETRRPDRLAGRLTHSSHGGFRFDLPIAPGAQSGEASVEPLQPAAVLSAHDALRSAVTRRDLRALLAAQGFSAVEIEALEALPGLRQDLDAFALRFLDADAPADVAMRAEGTGYLLFRGRNPEGRPFANFYHFVGCRGAPVLVKIAVNPQ